MKNSKEELVDALGGESRHHLLLLTGKSRMTKNSDANNVALCLTEFTEQFCASEKTEAFDGCIFDSHENSKKKKKITIKV